MAAYFLNCGFLPHSHVVLVEKRCRMWGRIKLLCADYVSKKVVNHWLLPQSLSTCLAKPLRVSGRCLSPFGLGC